MSHTLTTRDGAPSVAARIIRDEERATQAVPATYSEVTAWAEKNRIKPTGDRSRDLGMVNRMRKLLLLPPFALSDSPVGDAIVQTNAIVEPEQKKAPMPPRNEVATVKTAEIIVPPKFDHKAPVERTVGGLINALFDEIDLVRRGEGDETRIKQMSQLSVRVVDLMGTEIKFRKLQQDLGRIPDSAE